MHTVPACIHYNLSCTRFSARKTAVHVKEPRCTLLIITCGGRNCTKLVLKPLTAKGGLFISVLSIAPFL